MATTSRYAFALDILRNRLTDDPGFDVRSVFTKETSAPVGKVLVYANIVSDDVASIITESAYERAYRKLRVGIYAHAKSSLDSTEAGIATVEYGKIVERIDKVIDAMADDLPEADVSAAGYTISLLNVNTMSVSGFVDDKSDSIKILYEIEIGYTQY